jgi:hypothetical protein
MPCLLAQAICFIHLFGLQLCVAMHRRIDSRSSSSIQHPVDDRANMNVVFLRLVPKEPTRGPGEELYYVTVSDTSGQMRLKLTKTKSEALPIGNYESGVNLPVVRCFQECSLILMDEL